MLPVNFSEMMIAFGTGGVGVGAGIYIMRMIGQGIAWLLTFLTGRHDKREADADAATSEAMKLLREELLRVSERLALVEHDLEDCKKKHAEVATERDEIARERAELRGLLAGLGNARQHAALIVASEKAATKLEDEG